MEQPKKEKRPWARIYLLGVRVLCLGVLAGAVWLMLSGHYIAAVVLGISSPILEQGIYRCPYCRTPAKGSCPPTASVRSASGSCRRGEGTWRSQKVKPRNEPCALFAALKNIPPGCF